MANKCNINVFPLQRKFQTKQIILHKMNLKKLALAFGLVTSTLVFSQETENVDTLNWLDQRVTTVEDVIVTTKKLKVSGYIQTQWQSSQIDSLGKGSQDMKVGAAKAGSETTDFNRFGIRRGRIKVAYDDLGYQGVLQFDLTEKGLALKDAYLNILDPWVGYVSLKGGVFDRPFGYEISYSSSRRESPERSRIFQTLFPDERDMGAMLVIQAPKTSSWNVLKLEAGLFGGNGIYLDTDSKKDFIGHLSYNKALTPNIKVGLGTSYYLGSVAQTTKKIYSMTNGAFAVDSAATNLNGFAKRQYIGFDGQFAMNSVAGLTTIRAEYITGVQPGRPDNASSPKSGLIPGLDTDNKTPKGNDTYMRNISGGYVHLIQDIADTQHSIVVKYDWFDPNTAIAGQQIGVGAKTGKADMAYTTLGLGYMYRMNNNVRIMAYYDIVTNETTKVKGFFSNVNDNLVTVRLQYKF